MEPVYTPVVALARGWFKSMGWTITTRGAEHIPASGAAVIACNHVGYLDFIVVGWGALERHRLVRFMGKRELFDHRLAGPLMRGMRHVPVDRFAGGQAGLAAATAALSSGEVIGMFPEGTISRSFMPAPARTGAARMAITAGVPLIPAVVWGTQRILTKDRRRNLQRNVPLSLEFAAPLAAGPGEDAVGLSQRLMTCIAEMVDRAARDYPDQPRGPEDRWWLPAHLGGTAPTEEEARAWALEEAAAKRKARRAAREGA